MRPILISNHIMEAMKKSHLLVFLALFPSIFFGFQLHHDGYTLQTSKFTADAWTANGHFPFSQYGPVWSVILASVSLLLPESLVLLGLRILSVFVYALSILISDRTFRLICKKSLPSSVPLMFVATWYLSGPYYAWPSTFALLFMILATYCIALAFSKNDSKFHIFFAGCLISLTFMCRIQIGLLGIVMISAYFLVLGMKNSFLQIWFGFLFNLSTFVALLKWSNWLTDSTYDFLIFSSRFHLAAERGTERLPTYTLIIGCTVAYCLNLISSSQFILVRRGLTGKIFGTLFCLSLTILMCDFLIPGNVLSFIRWRILQRLFAGLVLGLIIYSLLHVMKIFKGMLGARNGKQTTLELKISGLVAIFSLAVYSQNYPLFSAHHAWYSLLPALLSASIFYVSKSNRKVREEPRLYLLLTILMIASYLYSNANNSTKAPMPEIVFISSNVSEEMEKYIEKSKFLIPKDAAVANLCSDPTIFVLRPDVKSNSRIYVWWDRFEQFPRYIAAAKEPTDYLMVCEDRNEVALSMFNQKEWALVGLLNFGFSEKVRIFKHRVVN